MQGVTMRRHMARLLLILFLIIGFAASGTAEPREEFDKPPSKEQMKKVRNSIETLRMWKLTKALDLDEKTSAQLFPALNKHDKKRADVENAMRDNMRELRESLSNNQESQLKGVLERLEQNHRSMQSIRMQNGKS